MNTTETCPNPADLRLVVTRELKAPCALVYRAWTDPKQLAQWMNCGEGECRGVTADVRPGGAYRIHMVSNKGDHIALGKYLEVVPNERLKLTWQWEHYPMPDSVMTVEFEDLGQATRLTLTHEGLPDQEDVADHTRGWTRILDGFVQAMEQGKIKG